MESKHLCFDCAFASLLFSGKFQGTAPQFVTTAAGFPLGLSRSPTSKLRFFFEMQRPKANRRKAKLFIQQNVLGSIWRHHFPKTCHNINNDLLSGYSDVSEEHASQRHNQNNNFTATKSSNLIYLTFYTIFDVDEEPSFLRYGTMQIRCRRFREGYSTTVEVHSSSKTPVTIYVSTGCHIVEDLYHEISFWFLEWKYTAKGYETTPNKKSQDKMRFRCINTQYLGYISLHC